MLERKRHQEQLAKSLLQLENLRSQNLALKSDLTSLGDQLAETSSRNELTKQERDLLMANISKLQRTLESKRSEIGYSVTQISETERMLQQDLGRPLQATADFFVPDEALKREAESLTNNKFGVLILDTSIPSLDISNSIGIEERGQTRIGKKILWFRVHPYPQSFYFVSANGYKQRLKLNFSESPRLFFYRIYSASYSEK